MCPENVYSQNFLLYLEQSLLVQNEGILLIF